MSRGTLRIYLGAAPGVGKTFAMLNEGRRRAERGTDVVVGFVETHGRPRTAEQMEGLEVVLVDELAHTNVPGSRDSKRWQDVEELLDAGIHVISTVNIQHLESLNDVVERITGITQRETVPDEVVRRADQIARRMGGAYHEVAGADAASALVDFARAENATQLVLGASQRSPLQELLHGSVINRVQRLSGPIDLHIISTRESEGKRPRRGTRRRRRGHSGHQPGRGERGRQRSEQPCTVTGGPTSSWVSSPGISDGGSGRPTGRRR